MGKVHEKDKVLFEYIDDTLASYDQEQQPAEPVEPVVPITKVSVAA